MLRSGATSITPRDHPHHTAVGIGPIDPNHPSNHCRSHSDAQRETAHIGTYALPASRSAEAGPAQFQPRSPTMRHNEHVEECARTAHRRSVTWLQPAWVWPRAGRRVPRAQVPLTSPRAQAAYRPREAAKWCETTSSVEYRKPIHGLGFQPFPLVSEVRRSGLLIRVSWVRVPPPEPEGIPCGVGGSGRCRSVFREAISGRGARIGRDISRGGRGRFQVLGYRTTDAEAFNYRA